VKITGPQQAALAIELAKYAIGRSDSTKYSALAEACGMPKEVIAEHYKDGGEKLKDALAKLGSSKAQLVALLATESGELTVHEYDVDASRKDRKLGLEDLAALIGIDAKAVRKSCGDKPAAPAANAPVPDKKAMLSKEARKRIADAQRKRWSDLRKPAQKPAKKAVKKAAKKGGRK
jgi:hypothetical protein